MKKAYKPIYLKARKDRHTLHKIIVMLIVTLIAMSGWVYFLKNQLNVRLQKIQLDTQTIKELMEEDIIDKELNSSLTEQLIELKTDVMLPNEARHDIGRYVYTRFKDEFGVAVAVQALRIVSCESKWNPNAVHVNSGGSVDKGLWQFNSVHGYADDAMFSPYQSTELAVEMYKVSGFSPWVCY